MHGRATGLVAGALAAMAMVGMAGSTRAAEITGGYRLVDPGPDVPEYGTSVKIDEDGKVSYFVKTSAGAYETDFIRDPDVQGRAIEVILRKAGSDANLLPEFLRTPQTASILDFNASGEVIGIDHGERYSPFYYNVETGERIDLKILPGSVNTTQVYGINDHGQIVGTSDGKAIFYASPAAVPVELVKLITNGGGWDPWNATGINNRGEIAGFGMREGIGGRFYKLEPQPVPEPSSVIIFALAGFFGSRLAARGRRRR